MRFLFLIRGDEEGEAALSAPERRAIVEEHMAYSAGLRERGKLVASEALELAARVPQSPGIAVEVLKVAEL